MEILKKRIIAIKRLVIIYVFNAITNKIKHSILIDDLI